MIKNNKKNSELPILIKNMGILVGYVKENVKILLNINFGLEYQLKWTKFQGNSYKVYKNTLEMYNLVIYLQNKYKSRYIKAF